MTVQFLQGDVIEQLNKLPEESVHLVVTSPPYYGLRSYLKDDHPLKQHEIGLEDSIQEHIGKMVAVFRSVRRVLRPDGVVFINYGDAYVTSPPGNKPNTTALSSGLPNSVANQEMRRSAQAKINKKKLVNGDGLYDRRMALQIGHGESKDAIWGMKGKLGLRNKSLIGMPWRVALALMDDGWILRRDIVWHKPNPMPESAEDRCTTSHEYVFHFVRNERYFCDAEAIRERGEGYGRGTGPGGFRSLRYQNNHAFNNSEKAPNSGTHGHSFEGGRNMRSVWNIAVEQFAGAHFATFPQKLITPMIKGWCPQGGTVLDPFGGAGTVGLVASRLQRNAVLIELNPEYVAMAKRRIQRHAGLLAGNDWSQSEQAKLCKQCGTPWRQQVVREFKAQSGANSAGRVKGLDKSNGWNGFPRGSTSTSVVGWEPACQCAGLVRARRPKTKIPHKPLKRLVKDGGGHTPSSPPPALKTP